MSSLVVLVFAAAAQTTVAFPTVTPTRDAVAESHAFISTLNDSHTASKTQSQYPIQQRADCTPSVPDQEVLDIEQRKADPNDETKEDVKRLLTEQAVFTSQRAATRKPQ